MAHAECESHVHRCGSEDRNQAASGSMTRDDAPKPRTPAMEMEQTMDHGTAITAFEASSEICTLESYEPGGLCIVGGHSRLQRHYTLIVHTGAKKLKMNAKPFGQPYTVERQVNYERRRISSWEVLTVCKITESIASTVLEFSGSCSGQCDHDSKAKSKVVK